MIVFLPLPLILVLVFLGYMALSNVRDQVRDSVAPRAALAASVGKIRPAFLGMENRLHQVLALGPEASGAGALSEGLETVSERIQAAAAELASVEFVAPGPEMPAAMERLRREWERYRAGISPVLEGPPADWAAALKESPVPAAREALSEALSTVEAHARTEQAAALGWLENRIESHSAMIVANGAMNLLLWIGLSFLALRAEKRREGAPASVDEPAEN
jgi:hypothetical protein